MESNIGIMGGSFDPPHNTHLQIASVAAEFLKLDLLLFIPAYTSPLKASPHIASFENRLAMLKIALKNFPKRFEILEIEKSRGGVSYSIDTALALKKLYSKAELFWIMGTDQLLQLDKWREIEKLSKLVKFACFKRAGYDFNIPKNLPKNSQIIKIPFAENSDSSSNARAELKNGVKNLDFIDKDVLNYIEQNKLYL